ncbi:hypothetical protein EYF80_023339 [Liparis tanakae]|uniref:Uncharacterized protein n=1 Tax=Liparis tanakae TaxID=230148 RepID=A0A4Z2HLN2_9TELE|nr:hypothetical protein EYF80_023339 [Liparis tanakae]
MKIATVPSDTNLKDNIVPQRDSTVAQPSKKPGSLVNHRTISRRKMASTARSANGALPSLLYSCLITAYASLSRSLLWPQPNVCFMLRRKAQICPQIGNQRNA